MISCIQPFDDLFVFLTKTKRRIHQYQVCSNDSFSGSVGKTNGNTSGKSRCCHIIADENDPSVF